MSKCLMVLLWCTSYPLPTLPHSTNIRQWCLCSPHHDTLGYCRKSLRGLGYLHHQQHKGVSKGETIQGDTTEGSWSEQAARNLPDFPHDSHELFTFLLPPSHRMRGATAVLVRHKPQWHRYDRRSSAVVPSLIAVAPPKTVKTADLRDDMAETFRSTTSVTPKARCHCGACTT